MDDMCYQGSHIVTHRNAKDIFFALQLNLN